MTMAAKTQSKGMLAAVLIRGKIGARHDVVRAMDVLRLGRQHICVVIPDTPGNRGLLDKCKDFITYGSITEETIKELKEKRGSLKGRDGTELGVFRMHPPRGGYGMKGIKVQYQQGGPLGLRPGGMDEFLKRMM